MMVISVLLHAKAPSETVRALVTEILKKATDQLRPTERHLSVAAKNLIFHLRRWKEAKTGENRVVMLTGGARIGKSKMTRALQDHLAKKQHRTITYHCSRDRQGSALYPIHKPAFKGS
ncbi:MAG: hypothetical protein QOJ04_2700 [Caballeronia sp.]|jgi:pantothenate kinase-related protein Tda10|nr:hypothetical protein [Caballeronia sp.]